MTMFSIPGFQTMGFWNKNSHYSSSGMMHMQEKDMRWLWCIVCMYCKWISDGNIFSCA